MSADALLSRAAELDASDPLARWRDEFYAPDPDLAYLDGNSLGMPPQRTLERVNELMREGWAGELINGWDHWLGMPQRVGDMLAPLIGARPGEVVVFGGFERAPPRRAELTPRPPTAGGG